MPVAYLALGVSGEIITSLDAGVIISCVSLPFSFATFVSAAVIAISNIPENGVVLLSPPQFSVAACDGDPASGEARCLQERSCMSKAQKDVEERA